MASRLRAHIETRTIYLRRKPRPVHGQRRSHNAQWKVAYADFATAMMAFFMLLWLMSNSEKVSLQGLADYFAPSNATMSNNSGSGQILDGAAIGPDGAKANGSRQPDHLSTTPRLHDQLGYGSSSLPDQSTSMKDQAEQARAERDLRAALVATPQLARLRDQVMLERTPQGLRIQITDTANRPMFKAGRADPLPHAQQVLAQVATTLARQPQRIIIQGHTDRIAAGPGLSNWDLSVARANAARRILTAAGVPDSRIAEVSGHAAAAPLFPDSPERAENRRITLLLLNEQPATPADFGRNR